MDREHTNESFSKFSVHVPVIGKHKGDEKKAIIKTKPMKNLQKTNRTKSDTSKKSVIFSIFWTGSQQTHAYCCNFLHAVVRFFFIFVSDLTLLLFSNEIQRTDFSFGFSMHVFDVWTLFAV